MPKRKSQTQFVEECLKINPNLDYSKVNYTNSKGKITIICPKHGEINIIAGDFLKSGKCPKCGNNVPTTKEFIERCQKFYPDYDYSETKYTSRDKPVTVKCNKHNYTWHPLAQNLERGQAMCHKCKSEIIRDKYTMLQIDYINKCNLIHNNKYDYSKTLYKNMDNKIIITCPKHGDFEQIAGNHARGNGCPKCKRSKGEEQVALILQELNYEEQYSININKCKVIVDFYIPEYNTIIEFNGIQHYIPVKHFGGELRFNKQIKRDELLRNYCQCNNINLIEITYQDNIKQQVNEGLQDRFDNIK